MPQLIIVTGAPGAGKSTLAKPLATALRLPLLSKDVIKESLFDSLEPTDPDPLVWSRRLGSAAMELLWALLSSMPAAVAEANLRPHSDYERARLIERGGTLVEIHCRCPIEVASSRYVARAQREDHHPTHVLGELGPDAATEYDGPIALGPVIEVDTTATVEVANLIDEVRSLLSRST